MSRQIQIRRGTATENNNFTGAIGEVTMDTTNKTLRVHDGTTRGGNEIMSKQQFCKYVTNCITEIPEDLKIELNDGTLTLKSGSKVHVANGDLDETYIIPNDVTRTSVYNGTYMLIMYNNSSIFNADIRGCSSGTISNRPSSTTSSTGLYFATDENKIYTTSDSGSTWSHVSTYSLPIAIITVSDGAISSIDQVFNGFGYVGSTVFVLPGVKGFIANGRYPDGTIKNNQITVSKVTSGNYTGTAEICFGVSSATSPVYFNSLNSVKYNEKENTVNWPVMILGKLKSVSGVYSNWKTKTTLHAIDYNDSEFIANQSMPSNKYLGLSLGATGTTYTAPGNGYFTVTKQAGASGEYIYIANNANGMNSGVMATGALNCRCFLPVSKGDSVQINYTLTGTTNTFRFVYANGSK